MIARTLKATEKRALWGQSSEDGTEKEYGLKTGGRANVPSDLGVQIHPARSADTGSSVHPAARLSPDGRCSGRADHLNSQTPAEHAESRHRLRLEVTARGPPLRDQRSYRVQDDMPRTDDRASIKIA